MSLFTKSNRGRDLKAKADRLYGERKWKKALEVYLQASEHLNEDMRIVQRLADLHKRLGQNAEAVERYKAVASKYAADGFWAKAIAVNKLILEIDPNDVSLQRKLAAMYSAQGQKRTDLPLVTSESRQAISIAGEQPRSMDQKPAPQDVLVGATLSISGGTPRTMEEAPVAPSETEVVIEGNSLGNPLQHLVGIPLFSDMGPDEVFEILQRLGVRHFSPDSLVCEEGDIGRSMYIIAEGWAEVFTRDPDGTRLSLSRLRGGDFFGEFGLLTNGQRNASVQAKTELEVLEITNRDFDEIAAKFPRIWTILDDHLRFRVVDTILTKSDVFRALTPEERKKLANVMKPRPVSIGETIMEEGTPGEEMYFLKRGKAAVTVQRGGNRVVVGELSPGDYFGEVAMLTGKPRTATILAKSECELFCLSRVDAAQILKGNREILALLKDKMNRRAQEASEVYQSYDEARSTLELV